MITSLVVRRLVMINMTGPNGALLFGKGLQCGGINVCHLRNAVLCSSEASALTNINHVAQVLRIWPPHQE
jgi:hypothetical protein